MSGLKLKDFVDEQSLNQLVELDNIVKQVHADYKLAAQELVKGLKIDVEVKGDLDKLQGIYNTNSAKAVSASETLKAALEKQAKVVESLSKKIQEKASSENLSVKEAKELASATARSSEALEKAVKAEQAMNKAQKSANSTRKSAAMTEEERIGIIKEALAMADREVHSIEEANEANKRLRQAVRLLRDTDEDYRNTLDKLNSTIAVNTDYVKRNSDPYTQQKMTIGNYKEEVKAAWMELNHLNESMGNFGIIAGSFGDSLQSLGNAGNMFEGLSGIGKIFQNKWLLGLGAVGAAGAGIGWWVNYNKGLMEATRLTQQFTEKSGEDLRAYRTEVQTIADFYGKDFKEVLIGANAVAKQFGISSEESLKLIKDGFIAGADANGEFLDTLREYPAYFKEAGISAETFIAITAQAAKSGIYSDKGVDVIKEGNLRIREMTTATADALEGIGISADKVQEQLRTGQKTTFDIIQMVSERLNELPDSASVVGTALADIFGGPGEDAGLQYIRTLKDIKTNLGDVKEETGELGQAQEDMIESQKRLATEISLLFDATGGSFETMAAKVKSTISSMTADLIAFVRKGVESVEELSDREEKQARADGERYGREDVSKQYERIIAASRNYVKQGMSEEEAFKKAKQERIDTMKKSLQEEEKNLKDAVALNEKYYDEYQNASLWNQMLGIDRTNASINSDIEDSWNKRMAAQRGYSSMKTQLDLVEGYQMPGSKNTDISTETADEKTARLEVEKSLQESRIALMEDGLDKEMAVIRSGYQQKIDAIKGNSSAEMALRKSLLQEMNNALSKASDEYENNRISIDLKNRLASAEKGSEEEMVVRLNILEKQKEDEIRAAKSNGADVSLIEQKFLNERQGIYEEYASYKIDEISQSAAAEQIVRNAQYNSEMKELEKMHAQKLVSDEEYETKRAEMTEKYSIDTAKATVASLEKQIQVENLSAEDREKLSEELQKARGDLADKEADAEIAAIERINKADEESRNRRIGNAKKWLQISSEAISQIGGLVSAVYDGQIQKIEEEQEINQDNYDKEIERIELLAENGVITEEEAEARKREAKDRTQKKEEQLEAKAAKLKQKQAVWDKAVQIAQTGIATARGIMEAWQVGPIAGAVMAGVIAAMGAVQVATIAATPIPAYREGTGGKPHPGGLALVGDGGRNEVVTYNGCSWITPDTPTFVNLPEGAEVFPDASRFVWNPSDLPVDGTGLSGQIIVTRDNGKLERKVDRTNELLARSIRVGKRNAYDLQYEIFKRTRL